MWTLVWWLRDAVRFFIQGKQEEYCRLGQIKTTLLREEPVVSVCMRAKLVSEKPRRKLKF